MLIFHYFQLNIISPLSLHWELPMLPIRFLYACFLSLPCSNAYFSDDLCTVRWFLTVTDCCVVGVTFLKWCSHKSMFFYVFLHALISTLIVIFTFTDLPNIIMNSFFRFIVFFLSNSVGFSHIFVWLNLIRKSNFVVV